jgi:N-carbamoyl-L-amino-acid hydrolase
MKAGLRPDRVLADLRELQALTSDASGAQRVAFTPVWSLGRRWLAEKLSRLPVSVRQDSAGNLWATLPGKSRRSVIIGGHSDSVPNGGWLDGVLNLLAGLEVLRFHAERDPLPVTLRLVDWADEEGARFGRSLFGSSACAGSLDLESASKLRDAAGVGLPEALAGVGLSLESVGASRSELRDAAAYLELHIEQGPVLLDLDRPLGTVLGTFGVERHAVTFQGQAAHSGSTPMLRRKDAFLAAARFALEMPGIARASGDGVCTIGSCSTHPGIVTSVVETCRLSLDQRHLDPQVLAGMLAQARAAAEAAAAEHRVSAAWEPLHRIAPRPFHPELIALCDEAIRSVGEEPHRLPSGPLHDASSLAGAGIPTAMLFVQSLLGLSHSRLEDTRSDHLQLSVRALAALVDRVVAWAADRD